MQMEKKGCKNKKISSLLPAACLFFKVFARTGKVKPYSSSARCSHQTMGIFSCAQNSRNPLMHRFCSSSWCQATFTFPLFF